MNETDCLRVIGALIAAERWLAVPLTAERSRCERISFGMSARDLHRGSSSSVTKVGREAGSGEDRFDK
jgi:hypothetical protein